MTIRPGIELANLSDVGLHRPENEDYYGYAEPESDADFQQKGRLAVIADGMGGYEGGQIASGLAVRTVRDAYLNYPDGEPYDALIAAFRDAHAAIQAYAVEQPALRGMGTTCTVAVVRGDQLYYGHVGDSRLYLIRGSEISQVTDDHSYVARLVREGQISPEEAAVHPDRNVLTAALGMQSAVPGDFSDTPVALQSNDLLLMCTDGLHGLVSDREMLDVALRNPVTETCQILVGMAKDRGGFDNITVQILRIV